MIKKLSKFSPTELELTQKKNKIFIPWEFISVGDLSFARLR